MAYGQLHFDKVDFVKLEDGVRPQFVCPVCKRKWQPTLNFGTPFSGDFNRKVSFNIPTHKDSIEQECKASGKTIELFVAVHRDADSLQICIQRSDAEGADGIPNDWWKRSET